MSDQTAQPPEPGRTDAVDDLRTLLAGAEDLARRLDDVHLAVRLDRLQRLLDAVAAERPVPVVPVQPGPRDLRAGRREPSHGPAGAPAKAG